MRLVAGPFFKLAALPPGPRATNRPGRQPWVHTIQAPRRFAGIISETRITLAVT
jgi:hypothetical protein